MTRVLQIGNFGPDNSTENDLLHALRELGVEVVTVQEDHWRDHTVHLPGDAEKFDLVLWTKTWDVGVQADQLEQFKLADVPIVGYHLDRWSGLHEPTGGRPLGRQNEIYTAPYFRWLDIFFTADPQDRMWQAAHINSHWTPPAISTRWTFDAEPNPRRWDFDVVFVGAWQTYHVEHTHRKVMLSELGKRFGRRFGMLPTGNVRIPPAELNELYATVPVVVGDSCLVGLDPYWSDRVPETIGRGGFLVHPATHWNGHYEPGEHLLTFRAGDWDEMEAVIRDALGDVSRRERIAAQGAHHVRAFHTYTRRMQRMLEVVL